MKPSAYYNECDPRAAEWLRTLSAAGEITPGHVDDRRIEEITHVPAEHARHHFFAGIGGWDLALSLAGWPAEQPVWTASLPCQPFSDAGARRGTDDERHLWPTFKRLVAQCRPPAILGEQVASKAGRAWLATVFDDLEELGCAVAGADLCAAGVGAPHIRQRLYWCAFAEGEGSWEDRPGATGVVEGHGPEVGGLGDLDRNRQHGRRNTGSSGWDEPPDASRCSTVNGPAHDDGERLPQRQERDCWENEPGEQAPRRHDSVRCGSPGGLGHSQQLDPGRDPGAGLEAQGRAPVRAERDNAGPSGATDPWSNVVYIPCADGKARPLPRATEPGPEQMVTKFPPLVVRGGDSGAQDAENSAEARVMRLRGYGNAINIGVAVAFIQSLMDTFE